MALTILFTGTVPKHSDAPADNEDAFRIEAALGRIALSDGASESFDAKNWAQLIVANVMSAALTNDLIIACAGAYEQLHDPALLTWSKAAAYERGSFATLLLAQDKADLNSVEITSVGDSLAVWGNEKGFIETLPYKSSREFDEKPTLLATRLVMNPSLENAENNFCQSTTWSYEGLDRCYLLCMTDALGHWLLSRQEMGDFEAYTKLRTMSELDSFQRLVESEREAGNLRRDDTTLVLALLT
ncbi:MAG: hypothetical protein EOO53_14230 [Gammaproteobacteria bacterium]|nr:MAG: hypothetical protein EOO53_14230 [Gammaproteobacteria bacterium]